MHAQFLLRTVCPQKLNRALKFGPFVRSNSRARPSVPAGRPAAASSKTHVFIGAGMTKRQKGRMQGLAPQSLDDRGGLRRQNLLTLVAKARP